MAEPKSFIPFERTGVTQPTPRTREQTRLGPGHAKAWALRLLVVPLFLLVCLVISAEGIRSLVDIAGMPLRKILPALAGYEETRKLDLAHLMAGGLVFCVWYACESLCRTLDVDAEKRSTRDVANRWICIVLLGLDLICFWLGLRAGGSFLVSDSLSIFSSTLATLLYAAIMSFVALAITKFEKGDGS